MDERTPRVELIRQRARTHGVVLPEAVAEAIERELFPPKFPGPKPINVINIEPAPASAPVLVRYCPRCGYTR